MDAHIPGLHHVTAICGDAQANVDFYVGVLGLRVVKRTVNFDAPDTYHLYYGDGAGRPGTIMTFFPWPGAPRGRRGTGQAITTSFAIPAASVGYWTGRLHRLGVAVQSPIERLGDTVIPFTDHDGLALELVAASHPDARDPDWPAGVPSEHAIRGFHGVTLAVDGYERSAALLTTTLGFEPAGETGNLFRFAVPGHAAAGGVDVVCLPDAPRGRTAVGTVHHVAWRARTDAAQAAWRARLVAGGLDVTPQLDRNYFRSIYFREPGGVLFEIATDAPGFAVDEPVEHLGSTLRLPRWLERHRAEVEAALPPLRIPPVSG